MELLTSIENEYLPLHSANEENIISIQRQKAYESFQRQGFPGTRHEEWKYTRVSGLINRNEFAFPTITNRHGYSEEVISDLPFTESAMVLVFVNGIFSKDSSKLHPHADVCSLQEAAILFPEYVQNHLGHSGKYINDGLQALNTAFMGNGLFIRFHKNVVLEAPVYIHHITQSTDKQLFVQPRILIVVEPNTQVRVSELYTHSGAQECFTNQVTEVAVYENARMEYYKVQSQEAHCHQVGTTHIQQVGKCFTHCVTITLSGGTVRNNLNIILEAPYNEAHMYGLYLLGGSTHCDNHTIVDNIVPGCYSNEYYKGIMDDKSNGVFNGKIFVRQDAQKTNAYQSNKNILLSDLAQANTKPQLEIFADDVKCSHGCTIGRLDDDALFYLKARGIGDKKAKALLLHAFAGEILDQVKPKELRMYLENLINKRLEFDE
jgi:Fe-S cluster assembly protein SufD